MKKSNYEIIEGGFNCNCDGREDEIRFPCGSGFSLGHWSIKSAVEAHKRNHKDNHTHCKRRI